MYMRSAYACIPSLRRLSSSFPSIVTCCRRFEACGSCACRGPDRDPACSRCRMHASVGRGHSPGRTTRTFSQATASLATSIGACSFVDVFSVHVGSSTEQHSPAVHLLVPPVIPVPLVSRAFTGWCDDVCVGTLSISFVLVREVRMPGKTGEGAG